MTHQMQSGAKPAPTRIQHQATRSAALDIDPLTGEMVPDPYGVRRQPARDGAGNANANGYGYGNRYGNGNGSRSRNQSQNGGYRVRPYVQGQPPPAPPWAAPRAGGTAPHTGKAPPAAAPWGGFQGGAYQAPATPPRHQPAPGYPFGPPPGQRGGDFFQAPGPRSAGRHGDGRAGPQGDPWQVPPARAAARRPAGGQGRDPLTGEIVTDPYQVLPSRAKRHAASSRPSARTTGRHDGGRRRPLWAELPVLVVIALVLAVGIKTLLVQAFYIPSESMVPTLKVNDRVLVNRLAYRFGEPQRGQVVVFVRRDPATGPDPGPLGLVQRAVAQSLGNAPPGSEDLIKRVIGVPGDTVEGKNGRVLVNGKPIDEPYLASETVTSSFGPVKVRPGHVFVMGDNREGSLDSRRFGQISEEDLVGRAVVLLWPFDSVGGL